MNANHKTSAEKRRAIYKYDDKFERINCRFAIGTKDRIKALKYSANNFIKYLFPSIRQLMIQLAVFLESVFRSIKYWDSFPYLW